ncbi:phosphoenolpyruvate synthase [Micromonospora echinospora]|uniref:Rifampicin phosphotransferase n=1 Tax=Micromonospora echinospora TaxID=1877 RepID=A0A1C5A3V1_MICEC|nr:rifamycin-inactivating phosphotransferase [Micromonospora echinospora]OZV83645.1 phosphoenolpyruvate synthase [Micromonospora echinospora]SCF39880.1 pyruvate, water dikinase [Micromonospora echinospora]
MIEQYVLDLHSLDERQIAVVGGKGAHLGGLSRIEGVRVPAGFCVTTDAFRRIMAEAPSLGDRLDQLSRLNADDRQAIRALSATIRQTIEGITIPGDLAAAIRRALAGLGEQAAYAVRSSATAEDLPTASFAGQQDTYLNVVGSASILQHVSRCWASLFTERAVTYRQRNGIDHRAVHMAVVVQRMVFPHAAGVLFTADPVTGNRKVATVDASFGLGEALVSGLVNPDVFRVRDDGIVARTVAAKQRAVHALPDGGTREVTIDPQRQEQPALTDAQVVRLVRLGRRIEAHFGCPQDIEWCLVDEDFQIVQSRPITTLFPVPAAGDGENHVYLSVGHQQMMTDPMRPLGISVWQLTAMAPMHEAGGRLFVDATRNLASPASRAGFLEMVGRSDPLTRDALETVLDRDDFVLSSPDRGDLVRSLADAGPGRPPAGGPPAPIETDPAIVTELIARSQASVAALRRDIRTKTGPELFDFLLEAFQEHKRVLGDPLSMQAIMAVMQATWWLNDQLQEWLGEKNAADTLTLSAPDNVTSEMGLALLDVADVIRPHPEVVAFLHGVEDEDFLDELPKLPGGTEARDAIGAYLDRYGMRCVGEIDITRPRWSERPLTLVPLILDNVRNFAPGAAAQRFEQGRQKAQQKEQDVLSRLRALPDGEQKAAETKRMIDRVRTFIGYREYPKYGIVSRYFVYKQALLHEAELLVRAGVLADREDIFYLTFQELHDVVRANSVDARLIRQRKDAFRSYHALTPPRVLTSDGEAVVGAYRRDDVPAGALVGLPVSVGTVEGRARVILDLTEAEIEAGDILVTAYTDPSWSPLFVAVAGLVTEVGGLMTHGAVIAREYGLPAVVGVPDATRLIRDGQRIRVHGTDGYVEILS